MKNRLESMQVGSGSRRLATLPQPPHQHPRRLVRALAACSLVSFWTAGADVRAQALPTGMSPVAGQVTARTSGNAMTVTNSPGAIINWKSFSIGAANSVRFDQANASSQVLNRVTGNDPSSILGSLSSNGRVWLLNQNGVLFGQGARVDVAGLVASTLNLTDTEWLTGRLQFTSGGAKAADVVNLGELRSTLGGQIALLGGTVRNEGLIDAPGGQILLAAGSNIELVDSMTPNVSVRLGSTPGEAVNLGRLSAAGGRIDIQAGVVNQAGIVRADSLERGPGGEIVMRATASLDVASGSITSADGGSGGRLTLEGDQSRISGQVSALGADGSGGQIKLLGREVGVLDGARIDASGRSAGGEILVGGGMQGKDASVPNAQAVYFGPSASILADATASGDGGHIVLWSDLATRAYGSLSARGGPLGGNGGLVETSGGWLDARPTRLDLSAPRGKGGQWLLDPFDVTINDAGPDGGYDPVTFTANANGSTISTGVIKGELELGNSVTISTGGGTGGQAGNITMANASLLVNSSGPGDLTLIADGNILMTSSTIQSQSAKMNVSLLAGNGGDGGILVQNSTIGSGGGNITLGGFGTGVGISSSFGNAAFSSSTYGILIDNSTVNAGTGSLSGNLAIAGASGSSVGNLAGVSITGPSVLKARNVAINGSAPVNSIGVEFTGGASVTTPGAVTVEGVGGAAGVLVASGSSIVSSPGVSGNSLLSLRGASTGNQFGVLVNGDLTANNGNSISLAGANPGDSANAAVFVGGANITVGSSPGSLTLGIINPAVNNKIVVTNGSTLSGGAGGILITGASVLTLTNTTASAHAIQLHADVIDFEGATSLVSNQPSGDVFVLSNRNNDGPLINFTNNSTVGTGGSGALQTSGAPARWIIWVEDIVSASFNPGSLPYDFTQYNATSASAWGATVGNGYVSFSPGFATVQGTINPRVYDTTLNVPLQGSLQATGPLGVVGNFISPPGLQYLDKNVGTAKPVALFGSYSVTFADSLGRPAFGLTLQSGMSGTVTPATVAVQGLIGNTKTYDATTTATYSGTPSVTPLGSDSLAVSLPNGAPAFFGDKNVGNGKAITIPSMSLTGVDAGNYVLVPSSGLTGNILPFQLTLSGVSVNDKVYDATTAATVTGTPSVNIFPGDSVSPLSIVNALFSTKDAGTNKVVQVIPSNLTGADAGNYNLDFASTLLQANITPAPLALTGLSAANKIYDATTSATLSGSASVTPLGSDSVAVSGTPVGNFVDKNVGTAKSVAVSGVTLSGTDAGNYTPVAPAGLSANITPATLAISGLVANNKVYDATTAATLSGSANVTPLANDVVAVSGTPVGTFADKNVGTGKSVSISTLSLTGADAGNYTPVAPGGLSANITAATLAIGGLVANNKVYDTTTAATLSGSASVTPLGSDSVAVSGTPVGTFADKSVGTAKSVAVSGVTLSGTDAGNYVASAPAGLTANITPAPLALTGLSAANKIYDATTSATLSGSASVTPLGSDSVAVSGTPVGNFVDKNVGTAKSVAVSGVTLSGTDAGNYTPVAPAGLSANITPATLAISGLVANNKVYDATTAATLSGSASVTPLANDVVAVSGTPVGTFADKNVGTGKSVSISALSLTGADAGNYTPVAPGGLSANITAATLAIGGLVANNKVYDATTVATLGGSASVTPLGSDSVAVSGTAVGNFADKNVGTAKSVAVSGVTLSGTDAGNYVASAPAGLTANITQASLAVNGLVANNKVYDAATAATLSGSVSVTPLGSDSVAVSGTPVGSFADKNVGTAKSVAVSGVTLSGTDAGNYTPVAPAGLSANITPATLAISGLVANNKVYDATTAATLSGSASVTPLANDVVAVSGTPVGTFADKNVGTGKSVSISALSLTGADAGNYTPVAPGGLSANITAATLAISGLVANNKVYDATTAATLSGSASVTPLGSDSVAVSGTPVGTFTDKNVGTAKSVAVSGVTLSGTDAGNYVASAPAGLTANITQASLAVNGLVANNKVYDATTEAALGGTATVTPLGSDSVTLSGTPSAAFSDKNVGTAKSVLISGYALSGNDAGNYQLAQSLAATANITPATLAISGLVANNKVYDATTAATLSGTATVTPLGDDAVSVSGTPVGNFANKNVGTGKTVSISALSLTGADAGNYTPVASAALSADIAPATLVVRGLVANNKVYDATTAATLSGSASVTPLGSDSVAVSGTPVGNFADKNVGTAKSVAVSGVTLSGTDAGNYIAGTSVPLSADITPATLRYVATPAAGAVGQPPPPVSGTVAGLLGADTIVDSTSGTLAFTTPVTALSPPGLYPIFGEGLIALNYVFVQDPANATALSLGATQLTAVGQTISVMLNQSVESVTTPPMMTKLGTGGLLDLTTPPAPSRTSSGSGGGGGGGGGGGFAIPIGSAQSSAFDPVDLASQSQGELEEMLATRDRFKQALFAEAASKLERDPTLADVPPCQTLKEVDLGNCLLTETLKREWLATVPPADRPASAAPAGATPGATPVVTGAAPAKPAAGAASPTPRTAPPAAADTVPEETIALPTVKRHVVTAALPQIDRKVALVIGVDNYEDPTIPHLANSVKDARAVAKLLESQLGYETIVLENPSKKTVIAALNRFSLELNADDSVVIYYAGHGDVVEATKLGYWQLADSDAKRPETWLSNADIGRLIAQLGASQVALISDSCYSGSLVSELRIRAATGALDPSQVLSHRSVVVMSSGGNEPVFDEGKDGHSPFAWNLMNTLGNLSNWQPGGNVFERVRFGVARELPQRPQYGAYVAGGHFAGGDYLFEQRQLESNPR